MKNHKVYIKKDKIISIKIGQIKCPECGYYADYIERKGKGFIAHFANCKNCNCNTEIDSKVQDLFQVGDRIRYYKTLSFGKNAKIDFISYVEGTIINKEKFITSYLLDLKVENAVFKNKKYTSNSNIYNQIYRGISSTSNLIELLTPQVKLVI